jgi:hypothetical protein
MKDTSFCNLCPKRGEQTRVRVLFVSPKSKWQYFSVYIFGLLADNQLMLQPMKRESIQLLKIQCMLALSPNPRSFIQTKYPHMPFQEWPINLFAASLTYDAVAPTGLFKSFSSTDPELYARNAE